MGMFFNDNKYILNEMVVKVMGLKFFYVGIKIGYGKVDGEIVGVIKDFNFKLLKDFIVFLLIRMFGLKNILYVWIIGVGV